MDNAAVQMVTDMIILSLKIAGPVLAAGAALGLLISIIQSITSIQDQTITFVPKIVVMLVVTVLLLPWVVRRLIEYSAKLFWLIGSSSA